MRKQRLFVQEKFYRQASFWRTVVAFLFIVAFLVTFWGELNTLSDWITHTRLKAGQAPTDAVLLRTIVKLVYNLVGIFLLFFIWALVVSQFVLPVQSNQERSLVFQRLLRYFANLHGPAVFIDRGTAIADENEMHNTRPGVAFVDLCSAIALERQWEHVDKGKDLFSRLRRTHVYRIAERILRFFTVRLTDILRRLLSLQVVPEPLVRIAGPGIVFTNMQEKIRGIADLRRQLRSADVHLTTRDGFEIQVPVSVVFSLGDLPETLFVTYAWDIAKGPWREAALSLDLRVIRLNQARNRIEKIIDDLDLDDRTEIHQYVKSHLPSGSAYGDVFTGHDNPPYHFDADRVFAALYSKALEATDNTPLNWTELPIHVAAEHLRNLVAGEDYNNLHQINQPERFPLYENIRPEFQRFMRNQGVLAYQFVARKDGSPLKAGDSWIKRDLDFYDPQDLKNSKVLRNRGIRVLGASFAEFAPRHPGVREQMVETWRVRWEGETQEIASQAEMEAINIVAQARRTAYQEVIRNLEMAYTGLNVPQDVLALRLFQTLEQSIMDPKTQALLPKDALSMLLDLRRYLQPGLPPDQAGTPGTRSTP